MIDRERGHASTCGIWGRSRQTEWLCLVLKGFVNMCAFVNLESDVCAPSLMNLCLYQRRKVSQLCVPVLHESCV